MADWAEEAADRGFEAALLLANLKTPRAEAAFRDIKRHIVRQVASLLREERERCARIAESHQGDDGAYDHAGSSCPGSIAVAIRSAQGEPTPRRHDDLVCMSHREVRLAVGIEPDEHGLYGVEECPKCMAEAGEPKGEEG